MPGKISSACSYALLLFLIMLGIGLQFADAQTFQVIHTFSGYNDGANPYATVTIDRAGNLYGTTGQGGANWGVVFKLTHKNSSWLLTTLHIFNGTDDGVQPLTPVLIAPNGTLYGTTLEGGSYNYGTVFELRPPIRACTAVQCPWIETVVYRFTGDNNGQNPRSGLLMDAAGNLYGEAQGGTTTFGVVYKLQLSGSNWTPSVVHAFNLQSDGGFPQGGLVADPAGNLYGTTAVGGAHRQGTVFQLAPSGSTWIDNTQYSFTGGNSIAGLIFDRSGNLFGNTEYGGCCYSGVIFEMSPAGGSWTYNELYDFDGLSSDETGPTSTLAMDSQGNLYGTLEFVGAHNQGSVFKLSPSGSGWIYTDLHDFTGGADGGIPLGGVTLDAAGNIYGTTAIGGNYNCAGGCGVVFEITP